MTDIELEKMLKALANKRRLRILNILKDKSISVGELAKALKLSFRSTSKHLGILYAAGFLDREQKSFSTVYRFVGDKFKTIIRSAPFV